MCVCVQAFCQFGELQRVIGVEIAQSRAARAFQSLRTTERVFERLSSGIASTCTCEGGGGGPRWTRHAEGTSSFLRLDGERGMRQLEYHCDNLFNFPKAFYEQANIVVMATDFPEEVWPRLAGVLRHLRTGTRLLTYQNLIPHVYPSADACPFIRIALGSTFETSWNPEHEFFLWRKRCCYNRATLRAL